METNLDPTGLEPVDDHAPSSPAVRFAGWRRIAATAVLGASLLAGLGVAAVNAATPSASPSTSSSAPAATAVPGTAPGGATAPNGTAADHCP